MPDRDPAVAPPFDQGVFLLHYNRGREAFQEGRYAEARRELEAAQRMRPDDPDVLNLLGLVYFKTNAFPEAEVIYRRLIGENPNVFILHSNLGLILFKQGKNEDAEQFLRRAIDLRPNYAKSHLYLGLLYRQKKKFGLALEHLKFAGADKLVREVEQEMRPPAPKPAPPAPTPQSAVTTQKVAAVTLEKPVEMPQRTMPGATPVPAAEAAAAPQAAPQPAMTAARKLQDAVDEPQHVEAKHIEMARKI